MAVVPIFLLLSPRRRAKGEETKEGLLFFLSAVYYNTHALHERRRRRLQRLGGRISATI